MTEKRAYRKVKGLVKEVVVAGNGLTLEEVIEKTGVIKWYCKQKLDTLVEKGEIVLIDGKYNKKEA